MSEFPDGLQKACNDFFAAHHTEYDMAHKEECGRYMQALIPSLQPKFPAVGFLRKNPSQTQYQGHAIDAFAYDFGGNLTHAVDVIARAEQLHPWISEGGTNQDPGPNFSEDINTAYKTDRDWLSEPMEQPVPNTVPWVAYNEQGFENLKKQLDYDYKRRPQGPDFDVSVWAARVFHSTYMGPNGTPLGMPAATTKHRIEWCESLHVSVDSHICDDRCKVGGPHHS